MSPHIRTVKTSSAARAVQIVYSRRKGSREIEHIGSAHSDVDLELLKTVARQRLAAGQGQLDLGVDPPAEAGGPLPITAARMGHLWDALCTAYDAVGFGEAAGGDRVFRQLVLARIIEPTSKLDSLRVLEEAGIGGVLPHGEPPPADLFHRPVARAAGCRVRPSRRPGTGNVGAVRCDGAP